MTDDQTPQSSPTIPPNDRTSEPKKKKTSPTKKQNSPTVKQGAGLNKIKQTQLVKWTIHVQEETRTFVGKAFVNAGMTQTDWVDSRLQQAARDELQGRGKSRPRLPAKTEDVADLMTQLEKRMTDQQTEQANAIQKLADQMQQQTEAINNRPTTLKEWLFGKPKKG